MVSRSIFVLSILFIQSAWAGEVAPSTGTSTRTREGGASVYRIQNLSRGDCWRYENDRPVEPAEGRCAGSEGRFIKTGNKADDMSKAGDLILNPRFSDGDRYARQLQLKQGEVAITFDEDGRAEKHNSSQSAPTDGCVLNVNNPEFQKRGLSASDSIILENPGPNLEERPFWFQNRRNWKAYRQRYNPSESKESAYIGEFQCADSVSSDREMSRVLRRFWKVWNHGDRI